MPRNPSPSISAPERTPRSGAAFRRRYDDLEHGREALIARLQSLVGARTQRSYKQVTRLLNQTFRKSNLVERAGILHTAAWLIDFLERMPPP